MRSSRFRDRVGGPLCTCVTTACSISAGQYLASSSRRLPESNRRKRLSGLRMGAAFGFFKPESGAVRQTMRHWRQLSERLRRYSLHGHVIGVARLEGLLAGVGLEPPLPSNTYPNAETDTGCWAARRGMDSGRCLRDRSRRPRCSRPRASPCDPRSLGPRPSRTSRRPTRASGVATVRCPLLEVQCGDEPWAILTTQRCSRRSSTTVIRYGCCST